MLKHPKTGLIYRLIEMRNNGSYALEERETKEKITMSESVFRTLTPWFWWMA